MRIRYPEYYGKFHCLAGECPDTCCVGWEIRVDEACERQYREVWKTDRKLGHRLRRFVRNGRIVPVEGKCPFLDGKGLCEIILTLGEDAACRTCQNFPRHREDYGKLQEVVLLLSCPEAARLVLTEEPNRYRVREFPKREANMEGIDEGLLGTLLAVRETIWEIGLESAAPFSLRMQRVLSLTHDVQRRLGNAQGGSGNMPSEPQNARNGSRNAQDAARSTWKRPAEAGNGRTAAVQQVLSRYRQDEGGERFAGRLKRFAEQTEPMADGLGRFLLMSDFMESLAELEVISPNWTDMLEKCRKLLYHSADSRGRYQGDRAGFWAANPEVAQSLERIFSYFLYSFFLAALYDGDAYGKTKMAVFCTLAIEELMMASWRMDEGQTIWGRGRDEERLAEQIKICHTFARQIENSNENRERLEQILKGHEFSFRRVITDIS